MTASVEPGLADLLRRACEEVGLDADTATVLRLGENALFRLADGVVVRIARAGQERAARKEVAVARWLHSAGVPAVETIPEFHQPVEVDGRAVTFWTELPEHRKGTTIQVARALRRLHALPQPTAFQLAPIAPFVRLTERLGRASTLTESDRQWMFQHLATLTDQWEQRPVGLADCVVHGDAWVGNVVSTSDGRVMFLDLERVAIGPPEWDLVHTAIKRYSFGWISQDDYDSFCRAYGHDVAEWDGYGLLRDIREFRMTCMAAQVAAEDNARTGQAAWRLSCIRGDQGPRPWDGWEAVP